MIPFLLRAFLYYLMIFSLFRLGFFLVFKEGVFSLNEILKSFYIGLKFDFKTVILTISPYIIFVFSPLKIRKKNWVKKTCFFLSTLLLLANIYSYYVDFGHYAYLKTRLTAPTVLDNMANFKISIKMLWESYPVIWILLSFFLICFFTQLGFKKLISPHSKFRFLSKKKASISRTLAFFLIAGAIYGKFSYYPLRWSDAYFSKKPFLSQLAMNPLLSFISTYRHRDLRYDLNILQTYYPQVREFLGITNQPESEINFQRSYHQGNADFEKANVIVIIMESMASDKSSLIGNPLDPTPELAQIAKEGLYYSHFFTPTEATARGVFATITSISDVVNKKSSSRNPRFVDHHVIMDQFPGYERFYFLGGSASWANIRSLIASNIHGVEIFEEGSYDSPRVDVWGISDLDLFLSAHKVFKKQTKPFVSIIQTSGFHRPYTIPQKSIDRGFKVLSLPEEKVKSYGFDSIEQLNSIRLQDFSLGEFFRELKKSQYGQNTIIAIFGDHGLPTTKNLSVPRGYYEHRIANHHTPFVLYYPKKIKPAVDHHTIASQVDVFPTIADVLNMPFKTKTMGRSLLAERSEKQNKAFLFSWHWNPRLIGIIDHTFYYEETPEYSKLFKYKSETPQKDFSKEYPEVFNELSTLSKGLYESALYLLENDKKPNRKTHK